jgi:hypothetical protein
MQLRYDVLREDALALAVHNLETSQRFRPLRLTFRWGLPVLVFSLLVMSLPTKFGVLAGAVFAVGYAVRIPGLMRRSCERKARKLLDHPEGQRALGPHVLSVEADRLTLQAPSGLARVEATAIERVTDSDAHVFVELHSGAAFVVPKRALTDEELAFLHALGPRAA